MANKKMNQVEVKAIAKKIIREVNEVNTIYNESVLKSKTYLDEIERIRSKNKLKAIREKFEKELKIAFGTDYEKNIEFSLGTKWRCELRKEEELIWAEEKEFKEKSLKKIINDFGTQYDLIVEEITIAQITVSDVQLLINSIKAKLI